MPELKYRDEGGEAVSVELEGREMVIGRLPDCDVVLAKPYVSRKHARVFREDGKWYVEDLGSAGGTFLNRMPLSKRGTLVDGDEIGIGDLRVTFNTPEFVGKRTVQRAPLPLAGRKPAPGNLAPGNVAPAPVPADADDAFAATNPAFVLHGKATGAIEPAGPPRPEIHVRHTAGSGAWSRLAARSRAADPSKVLSQTDRTGSLVDAGIAGNALRFSVEIVAGGDRASICRRALVLALRATRGDRAALAVRRETDGAYVTAGSVVASSGKFTDLTFQIDPELIADVVGTKEAVVAAEGNEAISDARTVRPTDVRTILCSPFLDKDRVAGWIYVDSRGVRTDLGPVALDMLAFLGSIAAHAASAR